MKTMIEQRTARRGFTLIELIVTVTVAAIAAVMIVPTLGSGDHARAEAAASILVSDLDTAQSLAISNPSAPIVVGLDADAGRWWIATVSAPDEPLDHPQTGYPLATTIGVGRAVMARGASFSLTNVADARIAYDAFGRLEQEDNPIIVFTFNQADVAIEINAETGFLTMR